MRGKKTNHNGRACTLSLREHFPKQQRKRAVLQDTKRGLSGELFFRRVRLDFACQRLPWELG